MYIKPYNHEEAKREYWMAQETILPPYNDGRRYVAHLPIEHQELRLGKWFPSEEIYYNAMLWLLNYYNSITQWMSLTDCRPKFPEQDYSKDWWGPTNDLHTTWLRRMAFEAATLPTIKEEH